MTMETRKSCSSCVILMNYSVIPILFAVQLAIAVIVFFVLKKLLDRELIALALERFERFKSEENAHNINEILVITHRPLNALLKKRLARLVEQKFKQTPLVFKEQGKIKGGMVIQMGEHVVDFSLLSRLKGVWTGEA